LEEACRRPVMQAGLWRTRLPFCYCFLRELCRERIKLWRMTYRFRTNINCSDCLSKVTPYLDANNEIKSWRVDTQNPFKILTVETDNLSSEMIAEVVKHAGYKADELKPIS
jgi:copper chaperone